MLNFNFRLFVFFSFQFFCLYSSVVIAEESAAAVETDTEFQNYTENEYSEDEALILDDETEPFPEEAEIEAEPEKPFFSFFDNSQDYLSSSVEGLARSMDQYFVEDEIFYESSGSYLRLRYSMIFDEAGKKRSVNEVRFKLRLPNTEKKFKLFFETSAIDEPYNVTTQTESVPKTVGEEGNYVLGIQAESGERFGWNYKPTIGADIDSSLDPFVKLKFSREDKFKKWIISWDETPYWYDSLGWGFDSSIELNRKIDEKSLFRSSTYAGWKNSTSQFDLSQVFSVFHTFNKKKAISFYTAIFGVSEPKITTTQFLVGTIYRENIHKDYLFMEIEPQIRYQAINRFRPEHSIVLRFELLIKK